MSENHVSGAATAPRLSYQDVVRLDRALRKQAPASRTVVRVALGGNANLDFVAPALRVGLDAQGFGAEVRTAAFGNWIGETFDAGNAPIDDVWIVWLSGMGASRGMTARPDIDVAGIGAAVGRLAARGAKVIVIPPEPLLSEDDPFSPFVDWRQDLVARLRDALPASAVLLPVEHLQRRLGMQGWAASRYWEQAKAPCHPDAMAMVGLEVGAVIARMLRPAVRAVAVDLDDTMWGGLVGEVGPEGLDLDPDGTGRPFLELQRLLLDLMDRGIPIAVVSKNDDDVARRPFRERPEMLLKLDDFVRFDASWNPKYQAIAALAAQLNIGIDAVCFLDDSPKERDEARRMLPGLIVPELDASPARRIEQLLRERLFMTPVVRDEDRLRVEFFKRAAEPAPADLDAYLETLGMTLEATRIDATNSDRSLSLLHKTNQFNLSLWRPSPAEFSEFVQNPENYAYAFRLKDRVTDAGIISVLMAQRRDDGVLIKGWVLSCRVFNRGVEWAAAEHLARWIDADAGPVRAPYTQGPRNALMAAVLQGIGLNAEAVDGETTLYAATRVTAPQHHIAIVER